MEPSHARERWALEPSKLKPRLPAQGSRPSRPSTHGPCSYSVYLPPFPKPATGLMLSASSGTLRARPLGENMRDKEESLSEQQRRPDPRPAPDSQRSYPEGRPCGREDPGSGLTCGSHAHQLSERVRSWIHSHSECSVGHRRAGRRGTRPNVSY